jgi:hypothetical protein
MPETHRLYLDQMLRLEVAQALRDDGHDVLRSAEIGQAALMIRRYCRKRLKRIESLSLLMNISAIG